MFSFLKIVKRSVEELFHTCEIFQLLEQNRCPLINCFSIIQNIITNDSYDEILSHSILFLLEIVIM